jgi:hypothetical protein
VENDFQLHESVRTEIPMRKTMTKVVVGAAFWVVVSHTVSGQWVQTGECGDGYINAIAVAGQTIFAAAELSVYRSTNNGETWGAVNNGLPGNYDEISSLAFNDDKIFAGTLGPTSATWGAGVFISTNNGDSWTAVDSGGLENSEILTLVASGGKIFAGTSRYQCGTFNMYTCGGGVFISSNNGTNWTTSTNPWSATINSLAISGDNIFAGPNGSGVFLSINSGASWAAVNNGLPANSTVHSFAIRGDTIFAGSYIVRMRIGANVYERSMMVSR